MDPCERAPRGGPQEKGPGWPEARPWPRTLHELLSAKIARLAAGASDGSPLGNLSLGELLAAQRELAARDTAHLAAA